MKEIMLNRPGNWELDEVMAKEEVVIAEKYNEERLDGAAMATVFMSGAFLLNLNTSWNNSIFDLFIIICTIAIIAAMWAAHNEVSDKSRGELHNRKTSNNDYDDDDRNIIKESIETGDAYGYGIGH